jgi:peptidoglycan/LPS O-acetylase OafA/YrhL
VTAGTEPLSAKRFPAADGVRGLAILVVLIHNSSYIERASPSFVLKLVRAVTASGWVGVEVFFVLSGFLITGILLDARGTPHFFRDFYIRRTLRIFPLYYAVLILAFFVLPLVVSLPEWTEFARRNQWWYWTYLANWGGPFGHTVAGFPHFWSLAVEEQFYVLWPFLVYALSRNRLIGLCAALLAVTPLIRWWLHLRGLPAQAGYEFTIARWDALAAGALLAALMRQPSSSNWLARRMGFITGASAVALALFVVYQRGFHSNDLAVQIWGQSLIALLSASLVYYCVASGPRGESAVQRAMSARWLRFFGKYSYAIYVFHFPIQLILSYYFTDALNTGGGTMQLFKLVAYLALVLAVSTLAALLSWRLIEKPCLDLKDRLAPRSQHPATAR